LACETLFPLIGLLPVSSQIFAIRTEDIFP